MASQHHPGKAEVRAVVPPPEKAPFYYKIQQPLRGIVSTLIVAAIAAIVYYVGELDLWWKNNPLALNGTASYGILPSYLILVAGWFILYIFYQVNWPFQKLTQPLQGFMAGLVCLVLGAATYYILVYLAGWAGYIFDIGVGWLFWLLFLGPFGGNPLVNAYGGEQPITGISGFITTFGMSLLTWWIIPASFLGIKTGLPWLWLIFAIILFRVWPQWPFPRVGTHALIRLGYLSLLSFILLWILSATGFNFFTNSTQATALTLVWLASLIITTRLFQFWPFHNLPEVPRGWALLAVGTGFGILAGWLLFKLSSDSLEIRTDLMLKVNAWGFGIFLGYLWYWGLSAGQWAPMQIKNDTRS